jgi:hypothetical protein
MPENSEGREMMGDESKAIAKSVNAEIVESVVVQGDLSKLSAEQRVAYYKSVCESMGLNPLTRPFDYITLNGKLTLYAKRDAAEQLRRNNGVSIVALDKKQSGDLFIVTASAQLPDGRTDASTGVVSIAGKKGDDLANAIMKAETKAKRRVTLSICGLGWLDETEVETIKDAKVVVVTDEGNIEDEPEPPAQALWDTPQIRLWLVEAGLIPEDAHTNHIHSLLKLSPFKPPLPDKDKLLIWAGYYREIRDKDETITSHQAARMATEKLG